jgi:alpha-glucosidase
VQVELWSLRAVGYLMQSRTMLDAVEAVTALTGRMKGLPEWTQLGAVVGLEGGTANVTAIVDRMYEAGVPMAGMMAVVVWPHCSQLPSKRQRSRGRYSNACA